MLWKRRIWVRLPQNTNPMQSNLAMIESARTATGTLNGIGLHRIAITGEMAREEGAQ